MLNKSIILTPTQLWGSITAGAILLSTACVGTWEIRKDVIDNLKQQIDAYEKS